MHLVQHHVLQFLVVHRTHEDVGFQRLACTIHKTRSDMEGLRHEMLEQQSKAILKDGFYSWCCSVQLMLFYANSQSCSMIVNDLH